MSFRENSNKFTDFLQLVLTRGTFYFDFLDKCLEHSFDEIDVEWGWKNDGLLKSEVEDPGKGFLVGDHLKVYCQLTEGKSLELINGPQLLIQQLGFLLDNEELSDIKVVTSTKTFHASKNILAGM